MTHGWVTPLCGMVIKTFREHNFLFAVAVLASLKPAWPLLTLLMFLLLSLVSLVLLFSCSIFTCLFLGFVGNRVVVADSLGERGIDLAHQIFHGNEVTALGLQPLNPLQSVGYQRILKVLVPLQVGLGHCLLRLELPLLQGLQPAHLLLFLLLQLRILLLGLNQSINHVSPCFSHKQDIPA